MIKQLRVDPRSENLSTKRTIIAIRVKILILLILRHSRKHKHIKMVIRNGILTLPRQNPPNRTKISLTTKPAGMKSGKSSRTSFAVQTSTNVNNLTRLRLDRIWPSEFNPKRSRLPQVRGTRENYCFL